MDVKQRLIKIVKDYRGESGDLNENTSFDDLGFDSLDKVELLMKIEEEYGITFDDDLQIENLNQLVAKIEKLIKK